MVLVEGILHSILQKQFDVMRKANMHQIGKKGFKIRTFMGVKPALNSSEWTDSVICYIFLQLPSEHIIFRSLELRSLSLKMR